MLPMQPRRRIVVPVDDRLVKQLSRLHASVYRMTGGAIGSRLVDNDMLLLTTTGRSTGRPHTVPLLYLEDDCRFVVIASYGGRPDHPEWYHNLEQDPHAEVRTRSGRQEVTAETMSADDRARWWPQVVDAYHDYATYQARTSREIPIVRLHPRNGEGG